jgi:phosphoglycolate phosphatase
MYDFIVFDLDGTLSDPAEGITASINYSLIHHGYKEAPRIELLKYIGPPLDQTFAELTNSSDERQIADLVAKYRERYSTTGYAENKLYDGVFAVLEKFGQAGCKLGVCTSKRADFAERILELFNIRQFFLFVDGGDIGMQKWQQLENLRKKDVISQRSVMVGDRGVDLAAAHRNGLDSAGVLWGYGSIEELNSEKPRHIFKTPLELLALLP